MSGAVLLSAHDTKPLPNPGYGTIHQSCVMIGRLGNVSLATSLPRGSESPIGRAVATALNYFGNEYFKLYTEGLTIILIYLCYQVSSLSFVIQLQRHG